MKRSTKLFERLLDTDVKADLLTLFHNNANLQETPEGLARKIGRSATEVERELEDLVQLGILKKAQVYSLGRKEIERFKTQFQSNSHSENCPKTHKPKWLALRPFRSQRRLAALRFLTRCSQTECPQPERH